MSKSYSLSVKLATNFNEKNIITVVEKAADVGFKFHQNIWDPNYQENIFLTPDEIVRKILNSDNMDEDGLNIFVDYQDTQFFFALKEAKDRFIELHCYGFAYVWVKEFINSGVFSTYSGGVDFGRYITLMLQVANNYPIICIRKEEW